MEELKKELEQRRLSSCQAAHRAKAAEVSSPTRSRVIGLIPLIVIVHSLQAAVLDMRECIVVQNVEEQSREVANNLAHIDLIVNLSVVIPSFEMFPHTYLV